MAINPDIGTETFFRWLYTSGYVGKESGLPLVGLGDDSMPDDIVAWALMVSSLFHGVSHLLADPAEVSQLYAEWTRGAAA